MNNIQKEIFIGILEKLKAYCGTFDFECKGCAFNNEVDDCLITEIVRLLNKAPYEWNTEAIEGFIEK